MIYLCSVYSLNAKDNPELMEARYRLTEEFVACHIDKPIFSPIVHCHTMAQRYDLPKDYQFWKDRDHAFIDAAEEVWVLKTPDPDWDIEKSAGVSDEIAYAKSIGKKVTYVHFMAKAEDYMEKKSNKNPTGTFTGLCPPATAPKKDPLLVQEGGGHYKNFKIQPIEFTIANNLSFLQGNVIKYVVRYKDKNGIEDLKKAKHYIDFMIKELEDEV